jgi:hypothetical protein
MFDDENIPYRVSQQGNQFAVLDGSGKIIMVCRDEGSANEYAALLNQAYRQGYKTGHRDAKRA